MKQKLMIIVITGIYFLTACEQDNETLKSEDYLIFGHFYGECMGSSCVEIFKLQGDKLFEDINDNYPSSTDFYEGNYMELGGSELEIAQNLLSNFPDDLMSVNDRVIGQPDAGDWGGLYIEHKVNGARKFWLVDQLKSNIPDYLHTFVDNVNESIALMKERTCEGIILDKNLFANGPEDYFKFKRIMIEGDMLRVTIQYGGGCDEDQTELKLVDSEVITGLAGAGVQAAILRNIRLSFKDEDLCEAFITRDICFDLTPIRVPDTNEVLINLKDWDEVLSYKY